MLMVLLMPFGALMLWQVRHEPLLAVVLFSFTGVVLGLPVWTAYAEAESALRKILQPEGHGRLVWH